METKGLSGKSRRTLTICKTIDGKELITNLWKPTFGYVYIGARFMRSSFAVDFDMGSLSFYTQLILKSAVIVSMSFIALFAGLALKALKAAIITSFFLHRPIPAALQWHTTWYFPLL